MILVARAALALALLWLAFYAVGRTLLLIPSSFHEGSLWRDMAWEQL